MSIISSKTWDTDYPLFSCPLYWNRIFRCHNGWTRDFPTCNLSSYPSIPCKRI